eukprot:2183392-Pleurochrysis_carterae.AAC.1
MSFLFLSISGRNRMPCQKPVSHGQHDRRTALYALLRFAGTVAASGTEDVSEVMRSLLIR